MGIGSLIVFNYLGNDVFRLPKTPVFEGDGIRLFGCLKFRNDDFNDQENDENEAKNANSEGEKTFEDGFDDFSWLTGLW